MATDERARHELYRRLEETIGPDPATTLMEHLPPIGWADVATKSDLERLATLTEACLDQHAAATKTQLAQFEGRINTRFERIESRFEAIDARFERVDDRFETLEHKLMSAFRGELNAAITAQTRSFISSTTTLFVALAGLVLALRLI